MTFDTDDRFDFGRQLLKSDMCLEFAVLKVFGRGLESRCIETDLQRTIDSFAMCFKIEVNTCYQLMSAAAQLRVYQVAMSSAESSLESLHLWCEIWQRRTNMTPDGELKLVTLFMSLPSFFYMCVVIVFERCQITRWWPELSSFCVMLHGNVLFSEDCMQFVKLLCVATMLVFDECQLTSS